MHLRHSLARFAAVLLAASMCAAYADVMDIAWGATQRFERRIDIGPGKFAEVCGKLAAGSEVRWRFDAAMPLDFNIHYHEGENVVYPVRQNATARAAGTLPVALGQDYCWMWTNPSAKAVRMSVRLSLTPFWSHKS